MTQNKVPHTLLTQWGATMFCVIPAKSLLRAKAEAGIQQKETAPPKQVGGAVRRDGFVTMPSIVFGPVRTASIGVSVPEMSPAGQTSCEWLHGCEH